MNSLVFVVDDESVIAQTLTAILIRAGFQAISFDRPSAALTASKGRPPDLLISDVMMPEMTGIELAIRLREANSHCKVLLFSGQAASFDLLSEARQSGHDFELLQKPVHPTDLLARLFPHA